MNTTNYQVTFTNYKNQVSAVYVPRCENEKEAWNRSQAFVNKYASDDLRGALVTKIEVCQSYEDFLKATA